jgi:hypothetical protein
MSADHDEEEDTTALIAAAAAAAASAVEAAVDVDVNAAVLAVEEAAHKVVANDNDDDSELGSVTKKNERKRSIDSKASHDELLAARRLKDRSRYAGMTEEQREAYNQKRRAQVCGTYEYILLSCILHCILCVVQVFVDKDKEIENTVLYC